MRIVQVSRQGCKIILSDQWPDQAGRGLLFISLDAPDFEAMRSEFTGRGVDLKPWYWGWEHIEIPDADGNRLWFPHPRPGKDE